MRPPLPLNRSGHSQVWTWRELNWYQGHFHSASDWFAGQATTVPRWALDVGCDVKHFCDLRTRLPAGSVARLDASVAATLYAHRHTDWLG